MTTTSKILLAVSSVFILNSCNPTVTSKIQTENLLHIQNSRIVDPDGRPVTLKGCNLGNWLVLEMWMLDLQNEGITDQHLMETVLSDRFGVDDKQRLMEIYRENWIIERDFKIIRSFGMNTIRLPFQYNILEDDDNPFTLREDAWKWLDQSIEWARSNGFYLILDLHGAPGHQSSMDHSGRSNHNQLWSSEENQRRTVWLWQEISRRYQDNPVIAAYDLLNEAWGSDETMLRELSMELYSAIRANGDDHIIIMPDFYGAWDFYGIPSEQGLENIMFTAHFYPGFFGWGSPAPYVHSEFLQNGLHEKYSQLENTGAPLLVGEFNVVSKAAGGGEMMRRYFDRYAEYGWPATLWSYKVLKRAGPESAMRWGMVMNSAPLADLNFNVDSKEEIEDWFKSLSTMDYSVDEDLQHWLTTAESPSELEYIPPPPSITEAPGIDPLPDGWHASDIGTPLPGGQVVSGSSWEIYGGGDDIWNKQDQFRYVWQEIEGDFSATVIIDSLLNTQFYSKAGLMLRNSLEDNSVNALINLFPAGNSEFSWRSSPGTTTKAISGNVLTMPNASVKLERSGTTVSGYILNQSGWELVGQAELPIGEKVLVGLATLSHDNSRLTVANYRNVSIK